MKQFVCVPCQEAEMISLRSHSDNPKPWAKDNFPAKGREEG